jgi:hypothetical protein
MTTMAAVTISVMEKLRRESPSHIAPLRASGNAAMRPPEPRKMVNDLC